MSRTDQVLPDGWKPSTRSVVTVEPSEAEPAPPAGLWRVFSQAPGTGQWWLAASDDDARSWASTHRDQVQSGCISRSGRVLIPRGYRRPKPADLSPAALQRMARGGAR